MHDHGPSKEPESQSYGKRHLLMMMLFCFIPIAILAAIVYANIDSAYLSFLVVLLCPLLMLIMHLPWRSRRKKNVS